MANDPVLLQLLERRRKAQQLIERGKAIAERGTAQLAECDRFEEFYRTAIASAPDAEFFQVPHHGGTSRSAAPVVPGDEAREHIEQISRSRAQGTLKATIVGILKRFPDGLPSGDLLLQLRQNGYPDLLRTSMSPQLSRMRGFQVENIDGRWVLKNKDAAEAKRLGSIFD